jgi:hypothetical protein
MKKDIHKILRLAMLSASTVVLFAQMDHTTAFTGTWKVNVAKSKFSPGPGPKGQTVTITPDGKSMVKGVDQDGKSFHWSFPWSGGVEVPIEGVENSTVIEKISGNTINHTFKYGRGSSTGHGAISKDGKTLTYGQDFTDDQGNREHALVILEK